MVCCMNSCMFHRYYYGSILHFDKDLGSKGLILENSVNRNKLKALLLII